MNDKPTEEQIKAYVASPYHCPRCGSKEIMAMDYAEVDKNMAAQPVGCTDCGAWWQDVYTLTRIEWPDTEE